MPRKLSRKQPALVIHGGAGALRGVDYGREVAHMRGLVELGRDLLAGGGSALDAAVAVVAEMEASGLYVAGRGASPNEGGLYELDAAVMDGATQGAGAVAALQGFAAPIRVARAVMEKSRHVLFAGAGAARFAREQGMTPIADPERWFTRVGYETPAGTLETGTVGCAALDKRGRLAAATSTAGVFRKAVGRVGDRPIVGAGVWADRTVAVSCTGTGEMFVRCAAAAQLAFRLRLGRQSLARAASAVLTEVKALGGNGGLIALTSQGEIAMPFNSYGMKRAALTIEGEIIAEVARR